MNTFIAFMIIKFFRIFPKKCEEIVCIPWIKHCIVWHIDSFVNVILQFAKNISWQRILARLLIDSLSSDVIERIILRLKNTYKLLLDSKFAFYILLVYFPAKSKEASFHLVATPSTCGWITVAGAWTSILKY